jgi:hypothetical protein
MDPLRTFVRWSTARRGATFCALLALTAGVVIWQLQMVAGHMLSVLEIGGLVGCGAVALWVGSLRTGREAIYAPVLGAWATPFFFSPSPGPYVGNDGLGAGFTVLYTMVGGALAVWAGRHVHELGRAERGARRTKRAADEVNPPVRFTRHRS